MYTCNCGQIVAGARARLLPDGGSRYAAYTEFPDDEQCCCVGTVGTLEFAREQAETWEIEHAIGSEAPIFSPERDIREAM